MGKEYTEAEMERLARYESYCDLIDVIVTSSKCRRVCAPSLEETEEVWDYSRACVKYVVFDLDATRRDNDCLRKILKLKNEENARLKEELRRR